MTHGRNVPRTRPFVWACAGALYALLLAGIVQSGPVLTRTAHAQVPDTGRQRQDILLETRETNRLLGEILEHLRTGELKVRVLPPDEKHEPRGRRGR